MSRFLDRARFESRWGAQRILQLAEERARSVGGTADEAIDGAITAAEARALGYLLAAPQRANLPESPDAAPATLWQPIADLAIFELSRHRDMVGDTLINAEKNALRDLRNVAAGALSLALSPEVATDRPALEIQVSSRPPSEMARATERWLR